MTAPGGHRRAPRSTEVPAVAQLPGGPVAYTLRRSPRARRLRVTLDPRRGIIATVPASGHPASGRAGPAVEAFLVERESWLRHHLARQAEEQARLAERGPIGDGALVRFRGELHRLRVIEDPTRRRSSVERVGDGPEDVLHVRLAPRDRRSVGEVLRSWAREEARARIEAVVTLRAPALRVMPVGITIRDPRSRWGSASRRGRLSFSWRLVLAPPEALETVVVHELAHLRVFGHGARFWSLVARVRPDHSRWRRWLREHATELHATFDEPASAGLGPEPLVVPGGGPPVT